MSHSKLRAWFETFTDSDPFTLDVIGALVDVAESTGHVFAGHQSMDDGLSLDAREAIEALENLETALDDAQKDDGIDFMCDVCHRKFYVAPADYDGQWDHPPLVPVCPECREE